MRSTDTPHLVTVRLPDGRLLIAHLDPAVPDTNSPLRRVLHAQHPDPSTGTEHPNAAGQ